MTKEDFLSGAMFKEKKGSGGTYSFSKSTLEKPEFVFGYIDYHIGKTNTHHGIINKIDDTSATIEAFLMGEYVQVTFNYSEFELCGLKK